MGFLVGKTRPISFISYLYFYNKDLEQGERRERKSEREGSYLFLFISLFVERSLRFLTSQDAVIQFCIFLPSLNHFTKEF